MPRTWHGARQSSASWSAASAVDMRRVKQRKDEIVASWSASTEASLRATENCTVYRGHARFVAPTRAGSRQRALAAPQVFINVGGRASVPAIPGIDSVPYLTNTSVLGLDAVPRASDHSRRQLCRAGIRARSSAASARRSPCWRGAPRLVPREDAEISDAIRGILESEGVRIVCGVRDLSWRPHSAASTLGLTDATASMFRSRDRICCSRPVGGRTPTIWGSIGQASPWMRVATSSSTINCGPTCRASGRSATATAAARSRTRAYNDFEIVAANLLDGEARTVNDRIAAYALYTDPPLGRAGMTEAEARAAGHTVLVGRMAMEDVARAIEKGETAGLMKLVVDARDAADSRAPPSSAPAATRSSTASST